MRNSKLRILTALASLALVSACGDDGGRSFPGGGADADLTAPDARLVDAGGIITDAAINVSGPKVTVTSPTEPAVGALDSDDIVTSDRITVLCLAEANPQSGVPVDTSSVTISVTSGTESVEVAAISTGAANEFEAGFLLTDFPNGALSITCSASDTSAEALRNSATNDTFLDLGPTVVIISPQATTSYANSMNVTFIVNPSEVTAGDTAAAAISNVELSISGVDIPNADVQENNGTYTATIVFDSPLFDPSLDQLQTLRVRAQNSRTSTPVVRVEEVIFNVDNEGPTITSVVPNPGEKVGGVITISAVVQDSLGIDPTSVVATVGGIHDVQLVSDGSARYAGLFDTRVLGPVVYPNIIVRAQDSVGNQSATGYLVALDNASPIISLDSPSLREFVVEAGNRVCSLQFDPLGDDAVSDGEGVLQLFDVRARLEDRANAATGTGAIVPLAQVDPASVELFLISSGQGKALFVDTDGDTICDDLNPNLVPKSVPVASNEVALINMTGMASGGTSFRAPDGFGGALTFAETNNAFDENANVICTGGTDTNEPNQVCDSVEGTRIITLPDFDVSVIYVIPPVAGLQCMGNAVDALATNLADGWACVGVRGTDRLGNLNVSAPIRICIDSDDNKAEGCPLEGQIDLNGAPDCTGTLLANGTVDVNTPCSVDGVFPDNELRFLNSSSCLLFNDFCFQNDQCCSDSCVANACDF